MSNTAKDQILILKDQSGKPCRLLHTNSHHFCLIKNRATRRLEIIEPHLVDETNHQVLHVFNKDTFSHAVTIKGVGSLSVLKEGERLSVDPHSILVEEDNMPEVVKWSSGVHATLIILLILVAKFLPIDHLLPEKKEVTIVTINTDELLKNEEPPSPPPPPPVKEVVPAKKNVKPREVYVSPRTDKRKSLKVPKGLTSTKKRISNKNAPTEFRQMGLLGALSNTIKGSPRGSGSGLKLAGGASGGSGRGAGAGIGNGTGGSGNYGSGGGYAQSLGGKGLIAAQVGGGGGGFGSGWGNGTRGSGSFGTQGKAGGHVGFGNSSVGGGVSEFAFPLGEDAEVEGGLDRDVVEAVIARYVGQIRACYERGLQQDPDLRGRVAVSFVINGQGKVKREVINHSSLRSKIVENCLLGKMRNWKFPSPVGGVNVKVEKTFPLQRVSQR